MKYHVYVFVLSLSLSLSLSLTLSHSLTHTHTYTPFSVVMEDLSQGGFNKLQDVLISGDVDVHITAIEGALAFIGHVHRTTWLEELENGERRELIDIHRLAC